MLPSSITHEPQKQHSVNYRVIILLQHPYASTVSVMGRTASNRQQYVCVSETISRQPTDCIDRSMRTVGVATTKRIWSAVCRPALAHACISYVGRTRAQVCRGAIIISPVETLCTYASSSICHCASHAYWSAGRIAWCIARPSAGNRSPYGDAAAHCPWFEGALLLPGYPYMHEHASCGAGSKSWCRLAHCLQDKLAVLSALIGQKWAEATDLKQDVCRPSYQFMCLHLRTWVNKVRSINVRRLCS